MSRLLWRSVLPRVGLTRGLASTTSVLSTGKVTHTGQEFEATDPRQARFDITGLTKQTNEQWAIDLIAKVPPKMVNSRVVSCDGGGGALGHPKIYINLDPSGPQSCNYCGLRFELEKGH